LQIDLNGVSMEIRFAEAVGSLSDLVSILNDETVASGLEASFSINTDNDTIIVTMNDPGDIDLGVTTIITDLSEIQTVSGFSANDLARLENNRLDVSDGINSFSVSFTTPPANTNRTCQRLEYRRAKHQFPRKFYRWK
jgi:hypothetical protein